MKKSKGSVLSRQQLAELPQILNEWNLQIVRIAGRIAVLILFFLFFLVVFQSFDKMRILFVLFSLVSMGIYQFILERKLKLHTEWATAAAYVFWGLVMVFFMISNCYLYPYVPAYFYGIVSVLLILIFHFSLSVSIFLSGTACVCFLLTSWFFKPHFFFTTDFIIGMTALLGSILGAFFSDQTKKIELSSLLEIYQMSTIDSLTGVCNRKSVEYLVNDALKQKAYGCFFVIDIDKFKMINDTQGHQIGDMVLQNFGKQLLEMFCRNEVIGRIGGDEFVLFLPDADRAYATKIANMLQEHVEHVFSYMNCFISLSIGISTAHYGDTYHTLFARADMALYDAKQMGRACHCFYAGDETMHEQRTVLVVDGTQMTRKTLTTYLTGECKVLQAATGKEASQLLHSHHGEISLILLDMHLPDMESLEFLSLLKKDAQLSSIPVILIADGDTNVEKALELGAADVIMKPFNASVVKLRVRNVFVHA